MKNINQVFLNLLCAYFQNQTVAEISPDLGALYDLTFKHNLVPIIYDVLRKNDDFNPSSNKFRETAINQIVMQQQRTEQFLNIYQKLLAANLKPLVIKGLVCRQLYPQSDYRCSSDEDIWIKPEDFNTCFQVLTDNNFRCTNKQLITDDFLNTVQTINFTNNILTIEVHINPFGTSDKLHKQMNSYFKDAFDTSISIKVENQTIYTLNPTNHYLFLIIHLYKHFISAGVGIRQVLDILIFYQHYQKDIDNNKIKTILKDLHINNLYNAIMQIGKKYLGFNLTPNNQTIKNIDKLTDNLIENGCFGTSNLNQVYSYFYPTISTRNQDSSAIKNIVTILFPPVKQLSIRYPKLKEKPSLYLWFALKRIYNFLKKIITGKLNPFKVYSLGKKRTKILKDMDVFK